MRLLLFDLMDTLVIDPYPHFLEHLKERGISVEAFLSQRNWSAFEAFERGEIREYEFFRDYYLPGFDPGPNRFPSPRKVKKELYRRIEPLPGILPVLEELKSDRELKMGVVSNYSMWYVEILKRIPELDPLIDFFFFSCEMGVRKPDRRYYEIVLETVSSALPQIERDGIYLIDDIPENLVVATEMGWQTHRMEGVASLREYLVGKRFSVSIRV